MIDDKVRQVHAELTARDKNSSLFVVAVAVFILVAGFLVLREYGTGGTAGVGRVVNLPDADRCSCTEEGCSGFLGVRVGSFLVGEKTDGRVRNTCATQDGQPQEQSSLILFGDSCTTQNYISQFTFEGRTSTFQSVCVTNDFLTAQNSNKLAEFLCEGNNLKVRLEPCACAYGACLPTNDRAIFEPIAVDITEPNQRVANQPLISSPQVNQLPVNPLQVNNPPQVNKPRPDIRGVQGLSQPERFRTGTVQELNNK